MATYGNDSIDALIGADRVRTRPASMLGSNGLDGARHGFTEIYGNALDECSAGYGSRLDVALYEDNSLSVRDYGRGVPLGWNDKKKVKNWNWHMIYNELYAGGKYDNGQWYLRSVGQASYWEPSGKKFEKLCSSLYDDLGVDIEEIPADDEYHRYKDIDIKHCANGEYAIRVNCETWDTLTWGKLNKRLNYLASVGLNGLGAASTQYTSEYFKVKSFVNKQCRSRDFQRGIPLVNGEPFDMFSATKEQIIAIPEEIAETDEDNGTLIHWKPDSTVFSDTNIGGDWLESICDDIADIAGVELHFANRQTGKEKIIPAGDLKALALRHCGNYIARDDEENPIVFMTDNFSHGTIKVEGDDYVYVAKCDVAIAPVTRDIKSFCYHNSVVKRGGSQYDGAQDAIDTFFGEKAKAKGYKLERADYENLFSFFVSSYSNYASNKGQTKEQVDDLFIYTLVRDAVYNKLKIEFSKGNAVIVNAVESAIKEAENRLWLKEQSRINRETEKIKREKEPEKFVSCDNYENKKYSEAELWITEGDSAKGSVKEARDKVYQAVYPIRGKGLNVLKANIKRIFNNKEIREIFALLGTGFDIDSRGVKNFNIDDLKFGKIIFATDADEDGYQIRVLLYCLFYKLAPELLRTGHVYIAETPRFRINLAGGDYEYALDDAERDKIIAENPGRVTGISRFKGLGEMDSEILRETTVHPDTRNLIQLSCDLENDIERELIDALFGADKYKQRKQIITTILGSNVADIMDENALMIGEIDAEDIEEDVEMQEV